MTLATRRFSRQTARFLDGRDTAVLPWVLVEFENGLLATVDMEMKWEKVLDE